MDIPVDIVDALLPQTQCTRCGYPACRPYADAIVAGEADINRCPPGGQPVIDALARLLAREPASLNPVYGSETAPRVALIDEERCIGCAKCLPACPVDAIVGAHRYMHTVVAQDCSGCELCIPPCPVDCIEMVEVGREESAHALLSFEQLQQRARGYRHRYEAHLARQARDEEQRQQVLAERKRTARGWTTRHDPDAPH